MQEGEEKWHSDGSARQCRQGPGTGGVPWARDQKKAASLPTNKLAQVPLLTAAMPGLGPGFPHRLVPALHQGGCCPTGATGWLLLGAQATERGQMAAREWEVSGWAPRYLVVEQGFLLLLEELSIALFQQLDDLHGVSLVQLPSDGVGFLADGQGSLIARQLQGDHRWGERGTMGQTRASGPWGWALSDPALVLNYPAWAPISFPERG